jgi:hypothetical protein
MRLTVREALACRALDCKGRTFPVAVTQLDAVIVAKVEFGEIAMQMFLAAMLIDAAHAALENREVAFR